MSILIRNHSNRQGPIKTKNWIIKAKTTIVTGSKEFGHLVGDFGVVLQRLEPVRDQARNIQCSSISRAEFNGKMFQIGRRSCAEIDHDIPDCPAHTTYDLHFRYWRHLHVHPAQGSGKSVVRNTGLDDFIFELMLGKFSLTERAGKKASFVGQLL